MRARLNGAALQEEPQILSHLPHGSIPAGWVVLEHLQQNGGQIPFDLAPQTVPAHRPLRRRAFRHRVRRRARLASAQDAIHRVRG